MELNRDILRQLPLALRIEIEENAQRKALTQSELAHQQQRILAELRKHTMPGARSDLKPTSAKDFAEVQPTRATKIVAELFNESDRQVEKRLAIVDAAAADLTTQTASPTNMRVGCAKRSSALTTKCTTRKRHRQAVPNQ